MEDAAPLPGVVAANRLLSALRRARLLSPGTLDIAALETRALRGASPAAFGSDDSWREPFAMLVRSLREEADLNPLGRAMARGWIVMALRARIRAVSLWRARPEILERPLAAPIVILGQMRSGTTRLQRLLACDDRLAHTRLFESLMPVPQPARRLRARAGLAVHLGLNPALRRIHPSHPNDAEEEFGLIDFSFGNAMFEAYWRVPAFTRWWEDADARPLYGEFRALLRTIAWSRGEPADRPWILKVPRFMEDVPALLETFPGARLVCLERDLDSVVASSASLVWNHMRVHSDSADRRWVGREWLRKTLLRRRLAEEARKARPDVPQVDIEFEAMNRNWRGEVERLYDFLGLPLTPAVLTRMTRYAAGAKGHLGHRYSLAQFGLLPAGDRIHPR
jgi:Sulfotransferase family